MPNPRVEAIENSLLPTIIDKLAQSYPDNIWAEYPSSSIILNDGFQRITYSQFSRAVNASAHHIQQVLGRRGSNEPLAYLAPNDPRCAISVIAAMKAGFHLFLMSERNSLEANLQLLDDVNCATLVTTTSSFPPVRKLVAERAVTVVELPPLEQLLSEDVDYPYDKEPSTAAKETAFMVHSSGSTGLDAPEGYEMLHSMTGNNRSVLLLPLSHGAGVHFGILNAFFNNATVILPLPSVPPTGEALIEILKHTYADWAAMAPLTLESISKNPPLLDEIAKHLKMLLFAGGSLPNVFGDVISSKIKLLSHLGSSESGPLPTMYRHGYDFEADWNYLQLHPAVGGSFEPTPEGAFELVFKKTPDTEPHQTVFTMYPDLDEYRTRDLFTPHPLLPDVWTHASRSDDVIVFLNGEKANPTIFESHVCKHPEISAALMFGRQRLEAGLLIELRDKRPISTLEKAQTIQRLWPAIQSANSILPGYAQVSQSHICFTDPGAPILRTLKGSVRRHATLDQYSEKINQLYADIEEMWAPASNPQDLETVESIRNIVRDSLREVTTFGEMEEDRDFFREGMDSLQVLHLVRQLRIKTALRSIQPSTVYLHPSVTALAGELHKLVHQGQMSEAQIYERQANASMETLQKYLKKIEALTSNVPKPDAHGVDPKSNNHGQVVLLTGSTGSLGSYILRSLLLEPRVDHIYCLNRSSDSETTQKERNAKSDPTLPTTFSGDKVTFLTADLSQSGTFGLLPSVYEKLYNDVTLVIHNAWPVDFNLPLTSYELQLEGMVSLVRFCAQSSRQAAFVFLSSISAVLRYGVTRVDKTKVPEAIITDIEVPVPTGYSKSKYIGERLLAHAVQERKIQNGAILRLGQVAGAARSPGRWKFADWIPIMVRSSQHLSMLPDSLIARENVAGETSVRDDIDWLPIDTVADAIVEVSLKPTVLNSLGPNGINVFNMVNPQRTSWEALVPSVTSAIEAVSGDLKTRHARKVKVVPPHIWFAELRANATASIDANISDEDRERLLSANPALRLMDFFDVMFGTVKVGGKSHYGADMWENSNAKKASEKLKNAERIDGEMMSRWVKQWCAGA
ncbi:NRPS-like enzyme [Aspergillus sclerotialis]|uniref:NRPS-like enzyme n=1 Tax=Aspergillus sclerotialis TaxID=2070753 RepID=A0A3A2ZF52_9EURO|nr:NRPS-like enzyme [Aspergillus sclerotialis]